MATCGSCGSQVPDSGRFCLSCGAAMVSGDELATMEFVD
jgi:predicted amidophosphoribosyltransferase